MNLFITKIAVYLPNGKIDFANSVCVAKSAREAGRIASTIYTTKRGERVQILETSSVPLDLIKTVYESNFK